MDSLIIMVYMHYNLTYIEFLVASYPLSDLLTESNIWNAFNAFKCKKSENITQESLEKVLGNRGSILCLGNFLCVNEDTPIQHMQVIIIIYIYIY